MSDLATVTSVISHQSKIIIHLLEIVQVRKFDQKN